MNDTIETTDHDHDSEDTFAKELAQTIVLAAASAAAYYGTKYAINKMIKKSEARQAKKAAEQNATTQEA